MNWFWNNLGTILVLMLVGAGVVAYFGIQRDREEKARFMEQCLKDRKEYECTAMWRAGGSHAYPIIIPVVR